MLRWLADEEHRLVLLRCFLPLLRCLPPLLRSGLALALCLALALALTFARLYPLGLGLLLHHQLIPNLVGSLSRLALLSCHRFATLCSLVVPWSAPLRLAVQPRGPLVIRWHWPRVRRSPFLGAPTTLRQRLRLRLRLHLCRVLSPLANLNLLLLSLRLRLRLGFRLRLPRRGLPHRGLPRRRLPLGRSLQV